MTLSCAVACRRAPPPSEARPSDSRPPSSASSATSETVAPESPFVPEGCGSTISFEGNADQILERLQAACAPNTIALNPDPSKLSPSAGKSLEARVRLDDAGACLRIAAYSPDRGANPTLVVKDANGQVVGEDALVGPLALVEKDGPICLRKPGELTLVVGVASGTATVFVRAWRAR